MTNLVGIESSSSSSSSSSSHLEAVLNHVYEQQASKQQNIILPPIQRLSLVVGPVIAASETQTSARK